MWAGMPGIFLRQIHEKQYPASLEPYTGNILLIAVTYDDARVKSLKPRCACTGVVLRLSDPPDMVQNIQWMFVLHRPKRSVDIKVERQLHDMRILGRVLCASGTRLAPTVVNTKIRSTEQSVRHLSTPTSSYKFFSF